MGTDPRRILIVEDEFLIAMLLEDLLSRMGHHVVACVARVDEAMKFVDQPDIDFAILDINLGGEKSFPVATLLRRRKIPFIFATGYGTEGLADEFRDELALRKPYDPLDLERAIAQACARVRS
ncbi:response regulator [Rhizobium hidalgonense]|uniref:response regulator n=1 Tax=Rhizobium hidalgonense TaxID=1538159 RepID=UPI001FEC5228|nr:response regulator [Rhizobium hidalgonense]